MYSIFYCHDIDAGWAPPFLYVETVDDYATAVKVTEELNSNWHRCLAYFQYEEMAPLPETPMDERYDGIAA